jgi:hypothetical protein
MARKRKHSIELPEHVHRVMAKGNVYFFYQANRGTTRQGLRLALPRDPASVEFWDALRTIVETGRSPDMVRYYSKARDQRVMARRAVSRRDGNGGKGFTNSKQTVAISSTI